MQCKAALLWIANLVYDLFCAAVNILDVVSDVIICMQFYFLEQVEFFWLSISIFAIAQICFSVLFTMLYGVKSRDTDAEEFRAMLLCFFAILPFGQLVPLIVWIGSFKFPWFDAICNKLGLQVRNDVQNETLQNDDPLSNYISKKMVMHGGFVIESIVESVPQSILQMVAIVLTRQVNLISVVSLVISIVSVSSRGLMVSFSIHRPTFVFNFACFVCDVFRVFCVVSWLFFATPSSFSKHIFFLSNAVDDPFTFVWWWKEVIVVCMAFLGGVLAFFSVVEMFWKDHRAARERGVWKSTLADLCLVCLITLFGLIVFVPALIVLEAMILSALPIIVFNSLSSDKADYAQAYKQLFAWIQKSDYHGRLRHVNQYFARRFLEKSGHREANRWAHPRPGMADTAQYLLAVKIMNLSDEQFSLAEMRRKEGGAIKRAFLALTRTICKQVRKKWNEGDGFSAIGIFYFCWLCIPVLALSALYSLAYPILSFCSVPWSEQEVMQQLFSLITFALLSFLLVLSYPVYQFYNCSSSVEFFHSYPRPNDFHYIEASYKARFARRQRENTGRMCVLLANHCANEDNQLQNHIVAVLPEITKFAGFSEAFAINVDKFLDFKVFCTMAQKGLELPSVPSSEGIIVEPKKIARPSDPPNRNDEDEDDVNNRRLTAEAKRTLELPVSSSSADLEAACVAPKSKSKSGHSDLLTGAMRSVGLDPQKILEVTAAPSALLHSVNSQYHEEIESVLLREASHSSSFSTHNHLNSFDDDLRVSLELVRPDDHGHFSTAVFHRKSWQQHLALPDSEQRRSCSSENLAPPSEPPALHRVRTA